MSAPPITMKEHLAVQKERNALRDRAEQLEAALVKLIDAVDAKDGKKLADALVVGRGLTF